MKDRERRVTAVRRIGEDRRELDGIIFVIDSWDRRSGQDRRYNPLSIGDRRSESDYQVN